MIGLVKQNIEFTLKKDRFLHCLKTKQPLNDHAANGCLEPKVPYAAMPRNGRDMCRAGFSEAEFRSESNLIVPLDRQRDCRWRHSAKLSLKFPSG